MSGCSLPKINDAFCHAAIKGGTCPGFEDGECINEAAITARECAYRDEVKHVVGMIRASAIRRASGTSLGHFIDQNDKEIPKTRSIGVTLEYLSRLMARVRRRRKAAVK